jgi:hypothetical protein
MTVDLDASQQLESPSRESSLQSADELIHGRLLREVRNEKPFFGTVVTLLKELGWKSKYYNYNKKKVFLAPWALNGRSVPPTLVGLRHYEDYFLLDCDDNEKERLCAYLKLCGANRNAAYRQELAKHVQIWDEKDEDDEENFIKQRSPARPLRHASDPAEQIHRLVPSQQFSQEVANVSPFSLSPGTFQALAVPFDDTEVMEMDEDMQQELQNAPSYIPSVSYELSQVALFRSDELDDPCIREMLSSENAVVADDIFEHCLQKRHNWTSEHCGSSTTYYRPGFSKTQPGKENQDFFVGEALMTHLRRGTGIRAISSSLFRTNSE